MHVIISGAGIGGLTAALALSRAGMTSTVLEAASQLGEIGAGIQLGPNAFHVLDRLGMGESLLKGAVYVDALKLMDAATGREIVSFSVGEGFRKRFNNPYVVLHRADLHQSLLVACQQSGAVEIQTSRKVERFTQDACSVRALCADGSAAEGDALIGADGIHSAVRAQIVGDGLPRVSGHTTYRSVIDAERMPEEFRWNSVVLWAGPKCHVVHYPLKGAKVFNLVATAHDDADQPVSGAPVTKNVVREKFSHLVPQVRNIIEQGDNWKKWVLCDRDPVERWTDGRATILGDAAHPTLQYFAQGACMAMEDGACVANALAKFQDDIPRALETYRQQRLVRTARIQIGSRLIGDHIYHPAAAGALVRDQALQSMGDAGFLEEMAWLYDVKAI